MRRFLRDAAVALFVGAVLVVLAIVIGRSPDEGPSGTGSVPAQEETER